MKVLKLFYGLKLLFLFMLLAVPYATVENSIYKFLRDVIMFHY